MMGLRRVGILIFVLIVIGCSGKSAETEAVHGQRSAASGAAQTLDQLTLNLPIGLVPEDVAAYANGSLRVQDRASVVNKSDGPAKVVNAGQSLTRIGVSALTGDLWSRASVDLASNSTIAGDLTTASGATQATGATVTGSLNTNVSLELESTKWTPSLPTGNSGDVQLEPNEIQQIGPAAYGQVVVKMGATLRLQSGVFLLDRLLIEPSAKLELLSGEPTVLYVKNELIFRGSVVNATDPDATRVQLLVVPIGTAGAVVEAPFKGTIFAPNGPVTLSGGTHHGAFFGQDFELAPDSKVVHRPFRWTTVLPPRKVVWREAPVIVGAWRDFHTGAEKVGDVTPPAPIEFEIPTVVPVRTGNAGNGTLDFRFRAPSGELVVCSYRGGANVPSPSTDLERMLGLRYLLESCTGGYLGGQRVVGTWFGLNVISADPATLSGRTAVALHLGGGCSDFLPPPIAPAEVVALRENFTYADVDSLPELDPTGRPALWHGLIYIEEKSQLQALDRMRIFWSARPLSEAYNDTLEGKCGRLEHATDGRGVVVYAVFPARFFNIFRGFGVQAENAGIAPPFKFIIPSSPDEPEYVNTDGSIKYEALAHSGFHEWLAQRAPQSPGFWDDVGSVVGAVTEPVRDAADWVVDNVIDPGTDIIESGFDYVAHGFDQAVDWAANAIDDIWETIQEGLQEFILIFADSVSIRLDIDVGNIDGLFSPIALFERGWGPNNAQGQRPLVAPEGAKVRVRQWGWGFLPVMDEGGMTEDGVAHLEAIEDTDGRGGDFCIELDTDYAMITSDLIPNEICDFAAERYGNFTRDVDEKLEIRQADLFALTQIKDSYDYSRTVIGHEPHRMEVLTGWVANNITKALNGGDPRAMCLCLDFPSVGTTALTAAAAAAGAGAGGLAGGPPGAVVGAIVGAVSSSILQKDLWWPDSDDYHLQYTSRGVMTHEYGHFNMCSMLYTEDGPNALRGLIQRIFDGDDSRDDDMAIMLEAVADTFSMQVVGGSNYLRPLGSYEFPNLKLAMGFCVEAPCMDFNYGGGGEYHPDSDFHDELARYVSLIHDVFDRADGNNRLAAQPWNGDVWRDFSTQGLTFSPTGYIAHDDEPVSLPGSAWKDWIVKWLERGRNPTLSNILGGLVDTMEQHQVNWCDRCEVFAAHQLSTPLGARMRDPSQAGGRTFDIRHRRWETCAADAWLEDWVGGVPERFLNLDNACNACAPLEFVNSSGVCTPCPPGEVPRGRSCIPCPNGTVPTPGNVCTSCEDNEIVVGNACVACPLGTGPDPARTTCVDCPADVVVDWAGVPMSCPDPAEVAVSQSSHPADACPWEFWVEVVGLDELVSRGGTELTGIVSRWAEQWPNPGQNNCLGSSAGIDFVAKTASGAWTVLAGSVDQGSWVPAGCLGDICLPAYCSLEAKSVLPAASFPADNRVRIRPSPQLHGNATPGHLWLWNNVVYPECEVH